MNEEKLVKIKGPEDGWYKEAVFVMRSEVLATCTYQDLQQRADSIIGNYAKKNGLEPPAKRSSKSLSTDQALNLILGSSICILIICLYLL